MSNTLTITIGTFHCRVNDDNTEATLQIQASDQYASYLEGGWNTIEDLLERFPTKHDLIMYILTRPAFEGVPVVNVEANTYELDTFSQINVYGVEQYDKEESTVA